MNEASTRTTTLTPESLIAAAEVVPDGAPFFMLNLLLYKPFAQYEGGESVAARTGRDAYHQGYVAAFVRLAEGIEVELAWLGSVITGIVGPTNEHWDELAIVRYPDFATFRRIVESPRYAIEAAPHRVASLDDWRLIVTAKLG